MGDIRVMFDITVLIAVHRRIETTKVFINSIMKNSDLNIQVVVCGDRSFLPSVDTDTHLPVTEYFRNRNDFFFITQDTPREPLDKKYVFVESMNTKNLNKEPSQERQDLPLFNYMYYSCSYAIPYCNSDLILGPTEDDLYFIKGWDVEYLQTVRSYNPLEHIFIHREVNSNNYPSIRPSKYPLTCPERHNLIKSGKNMMDFATIKTSDIKAFGSKDRSEGKIIMYDIPPPERGWPLSEHGPFLIHKELLNKIGGYHGHNYNYLENIGVYGNSRHIPNLLYFSGIRKLVQNTRVVFFHNLFKQIIVEG